MTKRKNCFKYFTEISIKNQKSWDYNDFSRRRNICAEIPGLRDIEIPERRNRDLGKICGARRKKLTFGNFFLHSRRYGATVAQSVEQLIRNQQVGCSSHLGSSISFFNP